MPRTIPILVIVGLAIYSVFDVLQTPDERIRRFPKTAWMVLVLIPVLGAALWFILGRPRGGRSSYGPPRVISLRSSGRPSSPDDDPAFLKKLEEEAWRRKRAEAKAKEQAAKTEADGPVDPGTTPPNPAEPKPPVTPNQADERKPRPNEGPAPSGPGIAPAG